MGATDRANRIITLDSPIKIDGKEALRVSWTNRLDSQKRVSFSYLVEYRNGQVLLISGPEMFLQTLSF